MERNQMRYVVEVARQGTITHAAEILHIAQPSLSNQIINLENELGISLFERTKKRIYLTEAGEIFVRDAERILAKMDQLKEKMDDLANLRMGKLRIGVLSTMVALELHKTIAKFANLHPSLDICLTEEGSSHLIRQVQSLELDAAFAFHTGDISDEGLIFCNLMESRFMAIVPKSYSLASQPALTFEDFADRRLIVTTKNFNLQRHLLSQLDARGIPYKIVTQCNQIETCYVLANQGMGVSFCTEATIGHYHCDNVAYIPIEGMEMYPLFLVYKKDINYHPLLREFVIFVEQYYHSN